MEDPPDVKLLPAASLACSVTKIELPDVTVELATAIVEVLMEIVPGPTVTVGFGTEVTAIELMVAPIVVAEPAVTPVKMAV
jgi:hypothetical protein